MMRSFTWTSLILSGQEVKYSHFAEEALTERKLEDADPGEWIQPFLDLFPSLVDLDGLDAHQRYPESLRPTKEWKENQHYIPQLHAALGASYQSVLRTTLSGHASFDVEEVSVLNSSAKATLGSLAPDIVIHDIRYPPAPATILSFIQVLTKHIDEGTHVEKMLVYLAKLLDGNPKRRMAIGVLTNLEHAVLYQATREGQNCIFRRSQGLRLDKGGFELMRRVIKLAGTMPDFQTPELNLPKEYKPVRALGAGEFCHVYEAAHEDHGKCAVKVFDIGGNPLAAKAYKKEVDILKGFACPGLPSLLDHSEFLQGQTVASIVTKPVVTPVSRGAFTEPCLKRYIKCLKWVHDCGLGHGDVEPKHLCMDEDGNACVIDFGDARELGAETKSLQERWKYRGTVRYADDDVLEVLQEWQQPRSSLTRTRAQDLVALAKSVIAIRYDLQGVFKAIASNNFQEIRNTWVAYLDAPTAVASLWRDAIDAAKAENYDDLDAALSKLCAPVPVK